MFAIFQFGQISALNQRTVVKVKIVYPIKVSWACSSWSFCRHFQATRRPASPIPRHPEIFSCVREEQRGLALLLLAGCCSSANLEEWWSPSAEDFHLNGAFSPESRHGWPQSQWRPLSVTCSFHFSYQHFVTLITPPDGRRRHVFLYVCLFCLIEICWSCHLRATDHQPCQLVAGDSNPPKQGVRCCTERFG